MKKALTIAAVFFCQIAWATPPSDASIQELLDVTQTKQLLDNSMAQIDAMMQRGMQQQLAGQEISAEDQQVLDEMSQQLIALIKSEMSWKKMSPVIIDVYQQSLTQSEVDGMLDFYKTDSGRALIAKMPLIMQKTMEMMQQKAVQMSPKMREIQKVAMAKIRENNSKKQ